MVACVCTFVKLSWIQYHMGLFHVINDEHVELFVPHVLPAFLLLIALILIHFQ